MVVHRPISRYFNTTLLSETHGKMVTRRHIFLRRMSLVERIRQRNFQSLHHVCSPIDQSLWQRFLSRRRMGPDTAYYPGSRGPNYILDQQVCVAKPPGPLQTLRCRLYLSRSLVSRPKSEGKACSVAVHPVSRSRASSQPAAPSSLLSPARFCPIRTTCVYRRSRSETGGTR